MAPLILQLPGRALLSEESRLMIGVVLPLPRYAGWIDNRRGVSIPVVGVSCDSRKYIGLLDDPSRLVIQKRLHPTVGVSFLHHLATLVQLIDRQRSLTVCHKRRIP